MNKRIVTLLIIILFTHTVQSVENEMIPLIGAGNNIHFNGKQVCGPADSKNKCIEALTTYMKNNKRDEAECNMLLVRIKAGAQVTYGKAEGTSLILGKKQQGSYRDQKALEYSQQQSSSFLSRYKYPLAAGAAAAAGGYAYYKNPGLFAGWWQSVSQHASIAYNTAMNYLFATRK